jgi:hypothetical protein
MSIQADIKELTEINREIGRLSKELSKLRKHAKQKEQNIISYLKEKDQHGVKFEGNALILDTQPKNIAKPKKTKEESYIKVLEEFGLENPKSVLDELMKAGKDEKQVTKLKIKKI